LPLLSSHCPWMVRGGSATWPFCQTGMSEPLPPHATGAPPPAHPSTHAADANDACHLTVPSCSGSSSRVRPSRTRLTAESHLLTLPRPRYRSPSLSLTTKIHMRCTGAVSHEFGLITDFALAPGVRGTSAQSPLSEIPLRAPPSPLSLHSQLLAASVSATFNQPHTPVPEAVPIHPHPTQPRGRQPQPNALWWLDLDSAD
jgi:hypothetical protein